MMAKRERNAKCKKKRKKTKERNEQDEEEEEDRESAERGGRCRSQFRFLIERAQKEGR